MTDGRDDQPLAHSARASDGRPQLYSEHVCNVRNGVAERAEPMLRYAKNPPPGLLGSIVAAATYHDLGKLDPDTQEALRRGREAKLRWDHVDAGVAHLTATPESRDWMAAWLVRSHHAPGLPKKAAHIPNPKVPDPLCRKLRGRRCDDDDEERHRQQIARTNARLCDYAAAHTAAADDAALAPRKAAYGLPMRLALSCLVDADHADTARFDTGVELPEPPEPKWHERLDRLCDYVRSLPTGKDARERERNRRRAAFFESCLTSDIAAARVACEAPVGLGKTTAVTAYLIRRAIRDRLRRLIIVAPFTNILTQSARRLRCALALRGEDPEQVVVEHHHRADLSDREHRSMAALWRAPVVLTTAVGFFETLAACNSGALRKLHALPGSAVFLDEAHAALPTELWPQNWKWIKELAEHWGCCFVFASGSLSRFWENSDIIKPPERLPELLPPDQGADVLQAERSRVAYLPLRASNPRDAVLQLDELIRLVSNQKPGPRLVILNTVQNAAIVAQAMRDSAHDVLHLSTALTPADRELILARVEERLDSKDDGWTLVATSCVEAGVDFSFRCGFRERFSVSSLIQVGGRVNRNAEHSPCPVYDFALQGEGMTQHPAARVSADILRERMDAGTMNGENPSDLVSQAMQEELRRLPLHDHRLLLDAEEKRDYPEVAQRGRVIQADTRLVVVDPELKRRLGVDDPERPRWPEHVPFGDLLRGSVQLWSQKIGRLGLPTVGVRSDLYVWNDVYDGSFLGVMAGVLKSATFLEQEGGVI